MMIQVVPMITTNLIYLWVLSLESLLKETQDGVNVLDYLREVSF